MAQDLPDDVWSQLAENWLDNGALHALSLTNRRMHRLVLPEVFRYLQFHLADTGSGSLMARLIRNGIRARFLFDSPELLRYTRFFSFWENIYKTDSIAEYLALQEGSNSSSCRGEAEKFVAILYDAIYRLIFQMPGLRELHISNTVMTPLCYDAISSRPLLTSLRLEPRCSPDITYATPAPPYALRLRDFACFYDTWTRNERLADPYFTDILDHYILELEKLAMSSNLLPLVVSCITSHRTLSLRSLSVMFPFNSSDILEAVAFLQVLRACPQLHRLSFLGEFPDVEMTNDNLPPPSLPNLSTFSGTSRLLKILSGGTNLVKVDIYGNFHVKEQALTRVILSPPTHLRELVMSRVIVSHVSHEFLRFIRSLAVFRNLEAVDLTYEFEFNISWKNHFHAQESHSTIKDLLDQLPCMRFLDIHSSRAVGGYDIGCPISKEGKPPNRGHPSLEGIYVDFICGRWSWDSRRGWEESNLTEL